MAISTVFISGSVSFSGRFGLEHKRLAWKRMFEPNVTGTWVYHCEVHPAQMQGATITVT